LTVRAGADERGVRLVLAGAGIGLVARPKCFRDVERLGISAAAGAHAAAALAAFAALALGRAHTLEHARAVGGLLAQRIFARAAAACTFAASRSVVAGVALERAGVRRVGSIAAAGGHGAAGTLVVTAVEAVALVHATLERIALTRALGDATAAASAGVTTRRAIDADVVG